MIKNIVFDFGDIFINLDKTATPRALEQLGMVEFPSNLMQIFLDYEKGLLETQAFLDLVNGIIPEASRDQIIGAWNSILLDLPEYRLEFLKEFRQHPDRRIFLLSNTNDLHMQEVVRIMGREAYDGFRDCFETFYLSYEMGMRKPDAEIFQFVLEQKGLIPEETLFIDDTVENTRSADSLGIRTWNLQVGKEDIVELPVKYAL